MNNKKEKQFPATILDLAQIRAKQASEEEQKRFEATATEIIFLLKKNNFQFNELGRVWNAVMNRIGKKIDGATLEKLEKL